MWGQGGQHTRHIYCNFFCWWGSSLIPREPSHENNAECVLGPEPMARTSALMIFSGPYSQRVLVSNTDTHTPLSETIDSTGAAKTDVEKLALWLSCQLCLQGQGGNEDSTSLLNPCIWRTLRTFFPLPSLRFPPSVSQCCLSMNWFVLWIHLLKAHYVPGTVHGTDLSENKTKIFFFLTLKSFLLEGWGRQTTAF